MIDGARTRDPQYHKLMLYQLSYDHHEGKHCATCLAEFHHRFRLAALLVRRGVTLWMFSVHDGFRGELGLPERNPEETRHERNGKHSHA